MTIETLSNLIVEDHDWVLSLSIGVMFTTLRPISTTLMSVILLLKISAKFLASS